MLGNGFERTRYRIVSGMFRKNPDLLFFYFVGIGQKEWKLRLNLRRTTRFPYISSIWRKEHQPLSAFHFIDFKLIIQKIEFFFSWYLKSVSLIWTQFMIGNTEIGFLFYKNTKPYHFKMYILSATFFYAGGECWMYLNFF